MDEKLVPIRVTLDRAADAAYFYLRDIEDGGVARTVVGADSTVNLDFDSQNRLVGIEILAASQSLPAELLKSIRETR